MNKTILTDEFQTLEITLSDYLKKEFFEKYRRAMLKSLIDNYSSSLMRNVVNNEEQLFFLDFRKKYKQEFCESVVRSMNSAGEPDYDIAMSYWYLSEPDVPFPNLNCLQLDFDFSSVRSSSGDQYYATSDNTQKTTYQRQTQTTSSSNRFEIKDVVIAGGSVCLIVAGIVIPAPIGVKAGAIGVGCAGLGYEGVHHLKPTNQSTQTRSTYRPESSASHAAPRQYDKGIDVEAQIGRICKASIEKNGRDNLELLKQWTHEMLNAVLSNVRG